MISSALLKEKIFSVTHRKADLIEDSLEIRVKRDHGFGRNSKYAWTRGNLFPRNKSRGASGWKMIKRYQKGGWVDSG
jgi:hypothetical protein